MLNLSTTSSVIRVITGSAGAIDVSYSYVDVSQSSPAPTGFSGAAVTQITTATTTTIVSAPASGTTRNVTGLVVSNDSTSVNNVVEVQQYDGTNSVRQWKGTLGFGERVVFDASGYWTYYGSDGTMKATGVNYGYIVATSSPDLAVATDAATLRYFGGLVANRMTPTWVAPDGVSRRFQERMSSSGWSAYFPNTGSTVGLNLGVGWTSGGTVTHPTPSNSSPTEYNQQKRTRWANVVTTTNQVLGLRTPTAEKRYWMGGSSGSRRGGFNFHARFAVGLWPAATVRMFVGLNDSNSGYVIADVLTGNGCGLWHATTDAATVLSFVVVNGGVATLTPITLNTALAAGQMFDFEMNCDPNGTSIGYKLTDLTNGTVLADTTTSTGLPSNTAFMGQELAMSNGTANTTVTTTAFELMAHECHSNL
jgi:hypothetical protein